MMVEHDYYNLKNFPKFVCHHGNWDIYASHGGRCAAIPSPSGVTAGCKASHFGDLEYVRKTLGVTV